jgi:hypothetical protein
MEELEGKLLCWSASQKVARMKLKVSRRCEDFPGRNNEIANEMVG